MNKIIFSLCFVLTCVNVGLAQKATNATQRLRNQSVHFQTQVVKVADKVHVAVGFSPANVSMIEGDDGLVIIDTGMSVDDGTRIMEEFRKLTDKPVKAIIFTHSHGDQGVARPHFSVTSDRKFWHTKTLEAKPVLGKRAV